MASKPTVTLPNDLVERCWRHADEAVAAYARGENINSLMVSSHGAESDPKLWANAKGAECAFAVWMERDPAEVLHWENTPDAGSDFNDKVLVDVKHTYAGRFLIWPVRKNGIYRTKHFDVLLMTRGVLPIFEICGWETKLEFLRRKHVAGTDHKLTEGTWHLHEDEIQDIHRFKAWVGDIAWYRGRNGLR